MDASKCLLFADDKNNFSFQLIFYLLSSFIIASIKQKKKHLLWASHTCRVFWKTWCHNNNWLSLVFVQLKIQRSMFMEDVENGNGFFSVCWRKKGETYCAFTDSRCRKQLNVKLIMLTWKSATSVFSIQLKLCYYYSIKDLLKRKIMNKFVVCVNYDLMRHILAYHLNDTLNVVAT